MLRGGSVGEERKIRGRLAAGSDWEVFFPLSSTASTTNGPISAFPPFLPQNTCLLKACGLVLERGLNWNFLLWATEVPIYGCLNSYSYFPPFQKTSWTADRSEYPSKVGKSTFLLPVRALEKGLAVERT